MLDAQFASMAWSRQYPQDVHLKGQTTAFKMNQLRPSVDANVQGFA
jgi:hypothetical protein